MTGTGTLRALKALADGGTVAESRLKGQALEALLDLNALRPIIHGSRRSYRAASPVTFRDSVRLAFGIEDIDALLSLQTGTGATRAEAVAATGDSKAKSVRTFTGFLVNSYEPVPATLSGSGMTVFPHEGSFVFIADFTSFRLPEDVVVVGIENSENFRHIQSQRAFFERELPQAGRVLFVSRYPQSKDLVRWLEAIPNRYVHFGDLDLAGISIFLTEFKARLHERASFLIPSDYRERLLRGSGERYTAQLERFPLHEVTDPALRPLIDAIHEIHKGYDQEGFIEKAR